MQGWSCSRCGGPAASVGSRPAHGQARVHPLPWTSRSRPMWLALFFTFIVVSIAHAVYFIRRVTAAVENLVPRSARSLRFVRWAYLAVACAMPLIMLVYAAYVVIARPASIGLPDTTLIDVLLVYPFWLLSLWSFQTTLLIMPLGAVHWLLRRSGFATGPHWHRRRSIAVLGLASVFAVYVPVVVIHEASALELRRYDVGIEDLPASLEGFQIALISDPQADRSTGEERLGQMVDAVASVDPDLIVIAGDMITREPRYIEVAGRAIGRLRARYGVYACIGDHDNFAYMDRERSLREVRAGIARHGVAMLDNEVVPIEVGDARLALALVTNNYVNRIVPDTVKKTLEEQRDAAVRVVVSHQLSRELVEAVRAGGGQLLLAGHTHGGQINLWTPLGSLVFARFETPYISGSYTVGGLRVIVSNGIGTSVAPFRYRAPATVDVVRLHRGRMPAPAGSQ